MCDPPTVSSYVSEYWCAGNVLKQTHGFQSGMSTGYQGHLCGPHSSPKKWVHSFRMGPSQKTAVKQRPATVSVPQCLFTECAYCTGLRWRSVRITAIGIPRRFINSGTQNSGTTGTNDRQSGTAPRPHKSDPRVKVTRGRFDAPRRRGRRDRGGVHDGSRRRKP